MHVLGALPVSAGRPLDAAYVGSCHDCGCLVYILYPAIKMLAEGEAIVVCIYCAFKRSGHCPRKELEGLWRKTHLN